MWAGWIHATPGGRPPSLRRLPSLIRKAIFLSKHLVQRFFFSRTSPPIDGFSDVFDFTASSIARVSTCVLWLHFSHFQTRTRAHDFRCLPFPEKKRTFPEIFLSLSIVFKPFAPWVGFGRPGKRCCEYSSEPIFLSSIFSFLSKAGRALPSLCAFSHRHCTPHSFG